MDAHNAGPTPEPPLQPFATMPRAIRDDMDTILQYHRDDDWVNEADRLTMESLRTNYIPVVGVETSLQKWHKITELDAIQGLYEKLVFISQTRLPRVMKSNEEHFLTVFLERICVCFEKVRTEHSDMVLSGNVDAEWSQKFIDVLSSIGSRMRSYWIEIDLNPGLSVSARYSLSIMMLYAFSIRTEMGPDYSAKQDKLIFNGSDRPVTTPIYMEHPVACLKASETIKVLGMIAVSSHGIPLNEANEDVLDAILVHVAHLQFGAWSRGLLDDSVQYTEATSGDERCVTERFVRESLAVLKSLLGFCALRRSILSFVDSKGIDIYFLDTVSADVMMKSQKWLVSASGISFVSQTLYPNVIRDVYRACEIPGARERYEIGTSGLNTNPRIVMQEMYSEIAMHLASESVMHASALVSSNKNLTFVREMQELLFLTIVSFQLRQLFRFPMQDMVMHHLPSTPLSMPFVIAQCMHNPDLPVMVHVGREYFVITFEMRRDALEVENLYVFSDIYSAMVYFLDVLEMIDKGVKALSECIYHVGEYRSVDMLKDTIAFQFEDDEDEDVHTERDAGEGAMGVYQSIYTQVDIGDMSGNGVISDLDRLILETERKRPKRKRRRNRRQLHF